MTDQNPNPDRSQPGSPRPPANPAGTSKAPPAPPGYVPALYVEQPSAKSGATKMLMYILLVLLLSSVMVNVYLSKYGPVYTLLSRITADPTAEQTYIPEVAVTDDGRIVVVEVKGTINAATAEYMRRTFETLKADPPAAIVLRVDSGGGGVTASDQIWHAITQFREMHKDVPVIASFGGVAASGGYYIAAPSDHIFCERTGITGSIGVMANIPGMGGLVEMIGVEMNTIIADGSERKADANDLFIEWYEEDGETLTPEGSAAMGVLKNLLNESYDTFVEVVVAGRVGPSGATKEELQELCDGGIYIGQQALDVKLVDEIGYLDEAIEHARKAANLGSDAEVTIVQQRTPSLLASLLLGDYHGIDMTNLQEGDLSSLVEDMRDIQLEYRLRMR